MDLNKHQKLNDLGVVVWQKRHQGEDREISDQIYVIDNKYIFIFPATAKEIPLFDKEQFMMSLSLSLGKLPAVKFEDKTNIENFNHFILLGDHSHDFLSDIEPNKITPCNTVDKICDSKQNKIEFLSDMRSIIL